MGDEAMANSLMKRRKRLFWQSPMTVQSLGVCAPVPKGPKAQKPKSPSEGLRPRVTRLFKKKVAQALHEYALIAITFIAIAH